MGINCPNFFLSGPSRLQRLEKQVNVLNRMAKSQNLPPFYDGVVSEERPYRREVANAVLEYVEETILNRG